VWNVLNPIQMSSEDHDILTAAREALTRIMEANWTSEHHMAIGRAYHAVAKLTGYPEEALRQG
jgi:hypothetical protein